MPNAATPSADEDIIDPTYDSYRSAPIPATSPTLSPTLSAITAGFLGSSSGMPASTLPTRSAPTSAALVKIPPPTLANNAIDEAPIPNVSIAPVISAGASLNTYFKSANQMDISKRPRPTTVKPITDPAEKAILSPRLSPSLHALAVLALDAVAIFIPTKPERPEKNPPVTNAKGTNHVSIPNAAITHRITNIAAKNTDTTVFCLLRYALAPARTDCEIVFIFSVPSENLSTFFAVNNAKTSAATAPKKVKITR